jgi:uncharacterized protein (TIGR03000 family)
VAAAAAVLLLSPAFGWAQRGGGGHAGGSHAAVISPQPLGQTSAAFQGASAVVGGRQNTGVVPNTGFGTGFSPFSTSSLPNGMSGSASALPLFSPFGTGLTGIPGTPTFPGSAVVNTGTSLTPLGINIPTTGGQATGQLSVNPTLTNATLNGSAYSNNLAPTAGQGLGQIGFNPTQATVNPLLGLESGFNPLGLYFSNGGGYFGGAPMPNTTPTPTTNTNGLMGVVVAGFPGTQPTHGPATIEIRTPDNAEVFVQGQKLEKQGSTHYFTTPNMNTGELQHYTIRATWKANGEDVQDTADVFVRPGDRKSILFVRGTPVQSSSSTP